MKYIQRFDDNLTIGKAYALASGIVLTVATLHVLFGW